MSAPTPADLVQRAVHYAYAPGALVASPTQGKPCRCWMCGGPARMKLAAYVYRDPAPEPLRAVHAAFWRKFSPEVVPSGR